MAVFLQAQDAFSLQQPQGCSTSQSQVWCEGTERHVKQMSGYDTSPFEAPAQRSAELATVEAESPSTRPEHEPSLGSEPVADKQEEAAPQATPDSTAAATADSIFVSTAAPAACQAPAPSNVCRSKGTLQASDWLFS